MSIEQLNKSKLCKHFSECGGCRFQDIDYAKQLIAKQERVKELIKKSGFEAGCREINSSLAWYYRNKMEFCFSEAEGGLICGLYSKVQKGKIVDLSECLIFSPDAGKILQSVKVFSKERNYSAYNKYSHQGFLRHLIIRETKFSNQIMLGIVTTGQAEFDKEGFVARLKELKLDSQIKSIYWVGNDSWSDAVVFEKKELIFGETYLVEKLDDLNFNIGIDTFFQINPRMVTGFYKKISDYLDLNSTQSVLDLFCGVGSIGMFLAKKAKFVWGVEVSQDIVDIAWRNANENKIDNISFFVSDARRFLNTQGAFYKNIDVLVVNPPRSGLSNRIIRAILRLSAKRIFYSSCNPDALFRDLEGLAVDYEPKFFESFDFFPHTKHLEVCCLLQRK